MSEPAAFLRLVWPGAVVFAHPALPRGAAQYQSDGFPSAEALSIRRPRQPRASWTSERRPGASRLQGGSVAVSETPQPTGDQPIASAIPLKACSRLPTRRRTRMTAHGPGLLAMTSNFTRR
jgi:hypothetical protein